MAAATVEPYGFHTPGLDQASICVGNEFPFGATPSEFSDKTYGMEYNGANKNNTAFGFYGGEVDNGLSVFDYQNAMFSNSSLTPPRATALSEETNQSMPLRPINTMQPYGHVRFEHGQYTPTDDEPSPGAKWGPGQTGQGVPIKQEALSDMPQAQFSEQKRKRPSKDTSQPKPKRRRSRKSPITPFADGEILDPVEDDKRNKFLERNRVAASKCRQKKKQWTEDLEYQARQLQQSKASLTILVASLKDEVMWLKGEMLKHTNCGCTHIREYMSRQADAIVVAGRSPPQSTAGLSLQSDSGSPADFSKTSPGEWDTSRRGSLSIASLASMDESRQGTANARSSTDFPTEETTLPQTA